MVTGSKELIRDINSTLVLETIIRQEPISRASIAKELGRFINVKILDIWL